MPSCISFISSSHSLLSFLSFLLCGGCCVCVRPSMGAVLAEQQSLRTHTRSLDTHCIQLTPHTRKRKLAHTQSPADTLASTQTAQAPLLSVSVWQISTILNISNSFLLVSATLLADPPPLRKHKEKMISFQLEQAQGNFPAVFTHSVRPVSLVHMWGAEKLSSGSVFVMDVHEPHCFFIPSLVLLWCSSSENCSSPGKRGKRFPGWGCSSGCNCSQRHDELVYKTT